MIDIYYRYDHYWAESKKMIMFVDVINKDKMMKQNSHDISRVLNR